MNFIQTIKDLLTGKDNQTFDLGRVSWITSMATLIGHSLWSAYNHTVVDLAQLAQAIGIVAASHGAALWAKANTEPEPKLPPTPEPPAS